MVGVDPDRDAHHLPLLAVALLQGHDRGEIGAEARVPRLSTEGAQQLECALLKLIHRLAAVDRPGRVVRILEDQPGVAELVNGLAPHGLAGVRRIGLAVVLREEGHQLGDPAQGGSSFRPGHVRLEVEQRQERQGRTLILLSTWQPQVFEHAPSFLDALGGPDRIGIGRFHHSDHLLLD